MRTFFYIIQRNGLITEIENIGDRFVSSFEQWQKGGLIIFPNLGIGINAVDISNILNQEKYQSYIDSVQPKLFIRNGAWYDIKDRSKPFRYEKWKELEIEEQRKLSLSGPDENLSKEDTRELMKKYRPEFMKNIDKVANKFKINKN